MTSVFLQNRGPYSGTIQQHRLCPLHPLTRIFVFLISAITGCGEKAPSLPAKSPEQDFAAADDSEKIQISSVFSNLSADSNKTLQLKNSLVSDSINQLNFKDVASNVGLEFQYDNGAEGRQLMVEATGGGCGWIDVDRDGFIDIYFPQGGNAARSGATDQPNDKLFRNIGGESFRDITLAAGIVEHRYGQGVAIGDFDNDGFDDLFVTNVGCNQLFHNQGDGSFQAVSAASGFRESLWSSSAAWGDIDQDGDLDLYVCNYCDYDPEHPMPCLDGQGIASICHPKDVVPVPDEFYRNLGNGHFEACARSMGLFGDGNRGLGVVIADFNNDRWSDIYVANDTTANFLFLNQEGQKFEEVASLMGCAVNVQGMGQASMGVGCGDFDGNGLLDLYLTHFTNEWNTLYTNLGEKGFFDTTATAGLVIPTMNRLAFGTIMTDLNQDGAMEIFVANGHINPQEAGGVAYNMKPQLFSFTGSMWADAGITSSEYFQRQVVGRGVATADYNNDGKLDLCVVHHDCPVALLRNECDEGNWLQVQLVGIQSARSATGTRVFAEGEGKSQIQELMGGTSYCSAMESQLNFGFPPAADSCSLRVEWTNGETSVLENVALKQSILILEPAPHSQSATRFVAYRENR